MKVGVVQAASVQSAVNLTERALKEGARIVLLPEQWTISFDFVPVSEFQRLARLYTSFVVLGAFNDGVSIISPIISHNGNIIGVAKKVHVEGTHLVPGNEILVFKHMGNKIGVIISNDIYYPEVSVSVLRSNVDLLLVPSMVSQEQLEDWKCVMRIRARETGSVILNANSYTPPGGVGHSAIYMPQPKEDFLDVEERELLAEGEGYAVIDVDLTKFVPLKGMKALSMREIEVRVIDDQPR